MDKERLTDILLRLDMLADNLEKDAVYFRKNIRDIKKELKDEGLL